MCYVHGLKSILFLDGKLIVDTSDSMENKEVENKQVIFKDYVTGMVKEDDMVIKSSKITLKLEEGSQGVLVKNLYLLCDPYVHRRMTTAASYFVGPFTPRLVSTFCITSIVKISI